MTNATNNYPPISFTREAYIEAGCMTLHVLLPESADLDGVFRAWCLDEHELLRIEGWNVTVELIG